MAGDPNLEWLGNVQPTGLVVAPAVLTRFGLIPEEQRRSDSAELAALYDDSDQPLLDPWPLFRDVLGWNAHMVAGAPGGPALPDDLAAVLPESETTLAPSWAVVEPGSGWQMLVRIEQPGTDLDQRRAIHGWEATPHQRLERLLRETGVPTGLLLNGSELRLVYAPKGETSGWLGFPLRALAEVGGRPMLGGLKLLLSSFRLFNDSTERRLPALLRASREAQSEVSAKLATQVLGALHELLRGLYAADRDRIGALAADRPAHLYEGLLTVLLRLVFLLYAEDRDLIPSRSDAQARALYEQGYGVRTLHARLLADRALYPDTMDERRGAWPRLLALFNLVHSGEGSGWIRGRGGKLFNPAQFSFLLGSDDPQHPTPAPVSDGCILRILDGLLVLDGERLSYRTLDVEQIGSVYETVMGFTVETMSSPALAIAAGKRNRTPVFVNLTDLLKRKSNERGKYLKDEAERSALPSRVSAALAAAQTLESLAEALRSVVDERGSPGGTTAPSGMPLLQPTDERRRTGSHYTPRTLTEPIVRHALEPAFARIGPKATPAEVLALRVCDPAMGSGAFLVEACRQLATRLVDAWAAHPDTRPTIPPDEDEHLFARRLVAQRCLYGVDRNPLATDLARLSLWLATLARDHEFTFLDHVLRSGDSLVGLTRKQIEALDWRNERQGSLFGNIVAIRLQRAAAERSAIRTAPDDVTLHEQEQRFAEAEMHLAQLRQVGDGVIGAFFAADRPRAREAALARLHEHASATDALWASMAASAAKLRTEPHPLRPFHWELEFPEVFASEAPGFDAIVGNPPFAGKNTLINGHRDHYLDWLQTLHLGAHGNADLVAHFFRRAFALLRHGGCFGLIATNTIGQGDTRESGLRVVLEGGGAVLRAVKRLLWPGEAAVVVSVVHVGKSVDARSPSLDERQVRRISAYLVEGDLDASPAPLAANAGKAFVGMYLLGLGFTFDDEAVRRGKRASPVSEMHRLIAKNPKNAERIFPYLGGEEVNNDPCHGHRRWCIDFNDFPLRRERMSRTWAEMDQRERARCRTRGIVPLDFLEPVAADWPDLLEIVERLVKPERDPQRRPALRERWWQFAEKRPGLRAATAKLNWVFAATQTCPHLAISKLASGIVFDQSLTVLPGAEEIIFCARQSHVQEVWTRDLGATFKDDLRFTAADSGATFPMPTSIEADQELADAYRECRRTVMVRGNEGLTTIYNRFHDMAERSPDIVRLREAHSNLDRAVLRGYGWLDLGDQAAPEFLTEEKEADQRYHGRLFWPAPFRDEVLARLLALNAERAADERARGVLQVPSAQDEDETPEMADTQVG